MKNLRVGFIGSGGMADAHLKGLVDAELFPDVTIAAFCDVVLERAQAQCDKYPASKPVAYASPQQMMSDAGLDACYVLLPPFAHGEAERACIEGNVRMPICTTSRLLQRCHYCTLPPPVSPKPYCGWADLSLRHRFCCILTRSSGRSRDNASRPQCQSALSRKSRM